MSSNEKKEIIEQLRTYLSELITLYERIKEENLQLFNENQKLLQINKEKDKEINKLKEKLETYKLSDAFLITSDSKELSDKKHDAKIRINRIVKEIDRCISLLNK